jgi:hypothetical protein
MPGIPIKMTPKPAVKYVADKFKPRDGQPLGFIEDEHLNVQTIFPVVPSDVTVEVVVNAIIDGADVIDQSFLEIAQRSHHGRRVENGARPLQGFVYLFAHKPTAAIPVRDKGACQIPMRIAAGR